MRKNWKTVRQAIIDNVKENLLNVSNSQFTDSQVEKSIDLFKRVLEHKTGIKKLDALDDSIIEAIFEVYNTKPGKFNPTSNIINGLEPFLKKVIFILTGSDYTEDKTKNLMWFLKSSKVLVGNKRLIKENQESFTDCENFTDHICKSYIFRNELHNSPKLKTAEAFGLVESGLVVYILAILKNEENLKSIVGEIITLDVQEENYMKYINSILSHDPSLKMLESDFGIKINSIEDFEVKIKARALKIETIKESYIKKTKSQLLNPIKFLPDIDGVMKNEKFLIVHGIATSGKSTSLKKLGKEFIKKNDNPYVFYMELGQKYKSISELPKLLDIINIAYKDVTGSDLDFNTQNQFLFLLDGLDEVPVKECRDFIIEEIISLNENKNIQIVISSRTNDYISSNPKIESFFDKFELLPINIGDVISLGQQILGDGSQFENFVKMVKKGNLLKAFPKTPLTSILLAILFKEKEINVKDLPKNITELYRKFTDLFLNRWDRSRGISEQFKIQKKEFVLQTIASHMHKNRMTSIKSSDLEIFLSDLAKKKPIGWDKDSQLYIKRLCERTNVLVRDFEDDSYRFFHLTIQEYLAALKLDHDDDNLLVENFYDEWWLNPNIFYAGNKTEYREVLTRVANYELYPADSGSKFNYFAHSSKVLLAAHNLDNDLRNSVLKSMVKVFNDFSIEMIQEIVGIAEFVDKNKSVDKKMVKISNQSLLDMILSLRNIFMEFFSSEDFKMELINIWKEIFESDEEIYLSDITLYCLSYSLSLITQDASFLEGFVSTDKIDINVRWYHIIDVDINVRKLRIKNRKIRLKLKSGAHRNSEYIQKQFKQRLIRHYQSITGVTSPK